MLAGTPGPSAHLSTMNASFRSRLGIGLLSDAATRAAPVEPLAGHGVRIDADALAAAVQHSQRYPYFVRHHRLRSRSHGSGHSRRCNSRQAAPGQARQAGKPPHESFAGD